MTWPTTIASATPGTVGAAADFDNHRDALNVTGGAWTPYTPTLTAATTDPTLGSSTLTGRYRLQGKTVDIQIELTVGAGYSAGSGVYRFLLPSGCAPIITGINARLGGAVVVDISTQSYDAAVYYVSPTTCSVLIGSAPLTHNAPFTWATGDRVSIHISTVEIT